MGGPLAETIFRRRVVRGLTQDRGNLAPMHPDPHSPIPTAHPQLTRLTLPRPRVYGLYPPPTPDSLRRTEADREARQATWVAAGLPDEPDMDHGLPDDLPRCDDLPEPLVGG